MDDPNYANFGPEGFGDGHSHQQLRNAFHQVLEEGKCASRDIDGFTITGDPAMIPDLFGKFSKVTTSTYMPKNEYTIDGRKCLFLSSTPFNLWVPLRYKDDIIRLYQEAPHRRGRVILPNSNPQLLFNLGHYIPVIELHQILQKLEVKDVAIISFGDKASFTWGMQVMECCRENDPNCEIHFDCAVQLIPECLHWIKQDHRVPLPSNGVPTEGYVPLVSLTDRSHFNEEFSARTKVEHNPVFVLQQMAQDLHQDNTAGLPLRGGVVFNPAKHDDNKHQSIEKVKVYSTVFSQWRQNSDRSQFQEVIHPTIKPYIERLNLLSGPTFIGCFRSMFPQLRIEVTGILSQDFDFNDTNYARSYSFIWDAVLATWKSLTITSMPVSFIITQANLVHQYAKHKDIPDLVKCFNKRLYTEATYLRRDFAAIVFNAYGLSSQAFNFLWYKNFAPHGDSEDRPIEWFFFEMQKCLVSNLAGRTVRVSAARRRAIEQNLQAYDQSPMRRVGNEPVRQQLPFTLHPVDGQTFKLFGHTVFYIRSHRVLAVSRETFIASVCDNSETSLYPSRFDPHRITRSIQDQFNALLNRPFHRRVLEEVAIDKYGGGPDQHFSIRFRNAGRSVLFTKTSNIVSLINRAVAKIENFDWVAGDYWTRRIILQEDGRDNGRALALAGLVYDGVLQVAPTENDDNEDDEEEEEGELQNVMRQVSRRRRRTSQEEDASPSQRRRSQRLAGVQFVNQHMAKWFEVNGEQTLFRGRVTSYDEEHNLWKVQYEDDDEEEMERDEVEAAIREYEDNME